MITKQEVEQVEAQTLAAEQARAAAEEKLSMEPHSRRAAQEAVDATQTAAAAARRLRLLREEFDAQEAARAEDQAALEKAAAKEVRAAGRELTAAREKVTVAAVAAQAALVELLAVSGAFNALTAHHAEVLAAKGLGLGGGQNGGGRELSGPVVLVNGVAYLAVEQAALVGELVGRLAMSLPRAHKLSGVMRQLSDGGRAPRMLSDVPVPEVKPAA